MKLIPCLFLASAACLFAQDRADVLVEPAETMLFDHAFTFENGQANGKPFSADQTTESSRTLSDGNRILTSKRMRMARDSEGRVRRETTVREGSAERTSVTISDPVGGVSYALDPATKTARKMPKWFKLDAKLAKLNDKLSGLSHKSLGLEGLDNQLAGMNRQLAGIQSPDVHVTIPAFPMPSVEMNLVEPVIFHGDVHAKGYSTTHEDLGDEKVEGVTAHGTRETTRIPAGAIGNEKAILITSERWFAPDLGIEVKAMRSDPRYGETKVSVSHVSQAEPDKSLFQVPPDYKTVFQDMLGTPLPPAPPHPKAH